MKIDQLCEKTKSSQSKSAPPRFNFTHEHEHTTLNWHHWKCLWLNCTAHNTSALPVLANTCMTAVQGENAIARAEVLVANHTHVLGALDLALP